MTNLPTFVSFVAPAFVQALTLSLGLTMAIGAQNAFVLRQGLRREHVVGVVLFCAIADALLITAGVMGMAQALGERPDIARALALAGAITQAAAFTLLNPHVYLDTVLLVGSIGAQQPAALRLWFVAGASVASLFWFCLLGFGARWLAPWFARPRVWQLLDGLIGLTMWLLAALLVRHVLTGF
jgi:L-lysine exporter family protein LysE/ArgO